MRRMLFVAVAIAAALFIAADASTAATVADYPNGAPANGINGSRHNLGSFGKVITTDATTEICVFCHTPHHTNQTNNLTPLWNRGTPNAGSYVAYGTTLAGTSITSVGSTSLACLSCHDGVTTFDNLVNAPGRGGVVAGGSDRGWTFYMPGGIPPASWGVPLDHFASGACIFCHNPAFGQKDPSIRLNIGTSLTNDHPVSVPYNATVAGLRPTNTVLSSINFTADLASSATTAYTANLAQNRWSVRGFITDGATIGDLLRNGGKVECSSCHDPHFKNLSWDDAEPTWYGMGWCGGGEYCSDGNFLRRVGGNTGSSVCRTCHNK